VQNCLRVAYFEGSDRGLEERLGIETKGVEHEEDQNLGGTKKN
jgi:hypothetical protein